MTQINDRKLNRLKDYDYSQDGFYFVTICTKNREEFFGEIKDEEMILNEYGEIAKNCWLEIPDHFQNAEFDEFIIMPNHIHGIVIIANDMDVGNADLRSPQIANANNENIVNPSAVGNAINENIGNPSAVRNADLRSLQQQRTKMYIPKIIHGIKSSVTRKMREKYNDFNFGWQKSYYDQIIRDEKSLDNIRQYIVDNPLKWDLDKNNLKILREF